MSEDVSASLDRLSEQVAALQAEVRGLERPSALPARFEPAELVPPGAHAWLSALDTPARRRPQLPRVVLEGLFLAAAAAAAAIAELDAVAIAGVMVGAWALVALIEWAASRADREPAVPAYVAGAPKAPLADPAWFAPPVEHTLLEGSTGDPVTAITRLPPARDDDLESTSAGEETVEQRPAV